MRPLVRTPWLFCFFVLVVIGLMAPGSVSAGSGPDTSGLVFTPHDTSSRIVLRGSSTLVDWSCKSSDFEGFITLPLPADELAPVRRAIRDAAEDDLARLMAQSLTGRPRGLLWIPVRSFECDNQRMTRDMHDALKASEHRMILFQYNRFSGVDLSSGSTNDALQFQLSLEGGLAMAGTANTTEIRTTVREVNSERVELSGEFELNMTDFKIEPPSALMGLIQAKDRVTVEYDITVRSFEEPAEARRAIREKIDEYGTL